MNIQVKFEPDDIELVEYLVALCEKQGMKPYEDSQYNRDYINRRIGIGYGYFGVYNNNHTNNEPRYALCTFDSIFKESAKVVPLVDFISSIKKHFKPLLVQLNTDYIAEIDFEKEIVKVGCSNFTFPPILNLADAIKKGMKQ